MLYLPPGEATQVWEWDHTHVRPGICASAQNNPLTSSGTTGFEAIWPLNEFVNWAKYEYDPNWESEGIFDTPLKNSDFGPLNRRGTCVTCQMPKNHLIFVTQTVSNLTGPSGCFTYAIKQMTQYNNRYILSTFWEKKMRFLHYLTEDLTSFPMISNS